METSLRAAIAGISAIVFLGDDQHYLCGSNNLFEPLLDEINSMSISCPSSANIAVSRSNNVNSVDNKMHHIEAKCHNLVLEFEVKVSLPLLVMLYLSVFDKSISSHLYVN